MEIKPKIHIWVQHAQGRSPGQRFRVELMIPVWQAAGYAIRFSNLLNEKEGRLLYTSGHIAAKAGIMIKSFFIRCCDIIRIRKGDLVFIYRESYWLGTTLFERLAKKKGAKLIFDFDDAIWLGDTSSANRKFAKLKRPGKINTTLGLCDFVLAGNTYLADYARQFNHHVSVLPTVVDTAIYKNNLKKHAGSICIGWTGSETTIKHWEMMLPVYRKLTKKYGKQIRFKVISNRVLEVEGLTLTSLIWNREEEVDQLQDIDIGIMPLPDDAWARGKCGFKGIQYMAMGIPALMSPVGVNIEIIEDGINGFLATTEAEWIDKLSLLIEDAALRERLGKAGRQTVVERYSVASQRERYLEIFRDVLSVND